VLVSSCLLVLNKTSLKITISFNFVFQIINNLISIKNFQESIVIVIQLRSRLLASFIRYVEAVFPGEFGIPKPFYFPFLLSYWTGHHHQKICAVNPVSIKHYLIKIPVY